MARTLAARSVDEAQFDGVGEHADGHARLAQQPLKPRLRTDVPAVPLRRRHLVEIDAGADGLHQHQPRPLAVRHRERRPQCFVVVGEDDFQFRRGDQVAVAPAEDVAAEARQIADGGHRVTLAEIVDEAPLHVEDIAIDVCPRVKQRERRDDKADRL